jgi:hypothetical protein
MEKMSDRYSVIAAMMQDPQNLLCIAREWERVNVPLEVSNLLPPPVIRAKGDRVTFPTMHEVMDKGILDLCPDEAVIEHVAEVFLGEGMKWIVAVPASRLALSDDIELGPFDSKEQATSEAIRWLEDFGFQFVPAPWDEEDIQKHPLTK